VNDWQVIGGAWDAAFTRFRGHVTRWWQHRTARRRYRKQQKLRAREMWNAAIKARAEGARQRWDAMAATADYGDFAAWEAEYQAGQGRRTP
jgi:homogentisate 1,2-dioxygenase